MDLNIHDDYDFSNLNGLTIINAFHYVGKYDSNEEIVLTLNNGLKLRIGTSEWLIVGVLKED